MTKTQSFVKIFNITLFKVAQYRIMILGQWRIALLSVIQEITNQERMLAFDHNCFVTLNFIFHSLWIGKIYK